MALVQGTQVVVIGGGTGVSDFHKLTIGSIVTAQEVFELNPEWQKFEDENGFTQYMKVHHYEVIKQAAPVDPDLPSKVIYGIFKNKEVVATTADREQARNVKSILGGKARGVSLYAYTATKEIR